MSTVTPPRKQRKIDYPSGDGRPMAETPLHRCVMTDTIARLESHYDDVPDVYVSGNMFIYYVEGDRNKHVSPDIFAVFGVPKDKERDRYFIWDEGKAPDVAIEVSSRSTREEDLKDKFRLYRDELKVREYFLFDPKAEYLDPPLQGYRLREGNYVRIKSVKGRLPSQVLGLQLERHGRELRLYDPRTGQWLPTAKEAKAQAEAAQQQAEREAEQLRCELEELRRRLAQGS